MSSTSPGVGWAGKAAVIERPCSFVTSTFSTDVPAELLPSEDLAPVDAGVPTWLVLTESGVIARWEPDTGVLERLARTLLRAELESRGRQRTVRNGSPAIAAAACTRREELRLGAGP